jgi:hypothetical protein
VVAPRPVLVVTGRHRPHEMTFLLLSIMLGLAYTLGAPPPQSVAAAMPLAIVHLWAAGLLASGVVGLAAILLPLEMRLSLRLEQGAMLIGAGALLITTAAVFSAAGWRGLFGGSFAACWMAANLIRALQIRRDLHEMP